MKCTYLGCAEDGPIERTGKDGGVWGHLCATHDAEWKREIQGVDGWRRHRENEVVSWLSRSSAGRRESRYRPNDGQVSHNLSEI